MTQGGRLEEYRITRESKEATSHSTQSKPKAKAKRKIRKHTERTLNRQVKSKESVLAVTTVPFSNTRKGHRVKSGYLNHIGLRPRTKDHNTALTRKVMLLGSSKGSSSKENTKQDYNLVGLCDKGVWLKERHLVRRNKRVKTSTLTERAKNLKGMRLNRMKINNVRRRARLKSNVTSVTSVTSASKTGLEVNVN